MFFSIRIFVPFVSAMSTINLKMTCNNHPVQSGIRFRRTVMLLCMAMLLLVSGPLFGAGKGARKVVRIPFQEFNRLMEVDEDNNPVSGYAYEYIQTIGTYARWEIQYIPCESFSDCMKKLLAGECDLFYDVSYTAERAKQMLFPEEPMGSEYYYLYAPASNTRIIPGDYTTINGRKVGVTTGTVMARLLKAWCKKRNVELQIIEYDDIGDKEAALKAGKIDLNLEISMLISIWKSACWQNAISPPSKKSVHRRITWLPAGTGPI